MTFPTVAVTVNLATLAGVNQAGVTVTATLDRDDVYLGVIVQSQVSGVTDASGNVVLQLFPNNPTTGLGTTGSVYYFFASIPLIGNFHALAQVPNSACNLATIANLAPVNGVFTVSGLQIWNSASQVFTGATLNITDTASQASSLFVDYQISGVSKFSVRKDGGFVTLGGTSSSFPALRRNGTGLDVRLADDSGYADLSAKAVYAIGLLSVGGTANLGANSLFVNTNGDLSVYGLGFIGWTTGATNAGASNAVTRLYRDADHVIGQRNGLNAQTFNLYGSFTDGSNYSRASFRQNGSNFSIFTEQLGTGGARPLQLGTVGAVDVSIFTNNVNTWDFKSAGHLFARTDNQLDIGAINSNRPRSIYAGTSINVGTGGLVYGRFTFSYPTTRIYIGDGTGYNFAFSKWVAGTTTVDIFTLNDSGAAVLNGTLAVSGVIKTQTGLLSSLPVAAAVGNRAFVTDSTVAAAGNFGAIVAGSGANSVPVYSDGASWRIG
jgi:hypothetical protein